MFSFKTFLLQTFLLSFLSSICLSPNSVKVLVFLLFSFHVYKSLLDFLCIQLILVIILLSLCSLKKFTFVILSRSNCCSHKKSFYFYPVIFYLINHYKITHKLFLKCIESSYSDICFVNFDQHILIVFLYRAFFLHFFSF